MKVKIEIPADLNDITLGQYQEFQKILDANKGEEESTFVKMKMIHIFCKVEIDQLNQLPIDKFDAAIEILNKTLSQTPKHNLIINVNGQELGFIPKLDDMTLGEYVDIESYLKEPSTYHKAMAVLYRPLKLKVKDTYLIEEYKGTDAWQHLMKHMGLSDALGALLFFYRLGEELLSDTIHSLEEEFQTTNMENVLSLRNDGDGINPLTTLQTEMLIKLKELQNYVYTNVYLN